RCSRAWRWPACRAGGGPVPRAGWAVYGGVAVSTGRVAGVSAGQTGVLARVMTAGAMRVIVSLTPACANVEGDLDLRARRRSRSVTVRYFAIWLVSAW